LPAPPHNRDLHIILADSRWPDCVFHEIVVDLQFTVAEEWQQRVPLLQRVMDRFAHQALRQEAMHLLPVG
jgi:hypothetical protein